MSSLNHPKAENKKPKKDNLEAQLKVLAHKVERLRKLEQMTIPERLQNKLKMQESKQKKQKLVKEVLEKRSKNLDYAETVAQKIDPTCDGFPRRRISHMISKDQLNALEPSLLLPASCNLSLCNQVNLEKHIEELEEAKRTLQDLETQVDEISHYQKGP